MSESNASELEEAWGHVHELTRALTGLVGGGSEMFIRRGGRYIADIPYCVERLREREQAAHRRALNETLRAKDAEAGKVKLTEALQRLEKPAPGVKMLPPWAIGIIRAALSSARGED